MSGLLLPSSKDLQKRFSKMLEGLTLDMAQQIVTAAEYPHEGSERNMVLQVIKAWLIRPRTVEGDRKAISSINQVYVSDELAAAHSSVHPIVVEMQQRFSKIVTESELERKVVMTKAMNSWLDGFENFDLPKPQTGTKSDDAPLTPSVVQELKSPDTAVAAREEQFQKLLLAIVKIIPSTLKPFEKAELMSRVSGAIGLKTSAPARTCVQVGQAPSPRSITSVLKQTAAQGPMKVPPQKVDPALKALNDERKAKVLEIKKELQRLKVGKLGTDHSLIRELGEIGERIKSFRGPPVPMANEGVGSNAAKKSYSDVSKTPQ